MRDNPGDVPPSVDFPNDIEPTPPSEREDASKFSASASRSKKQIRKELEDFIDADEWYIDEVTGSRSWPGYVIRWTKDGNEYAMVSDSYTTKKANARAAYYWLHETRMRNQRPVSTAQDSFAAAQLPSGKELPAEPVGPDGHTPPHVVLGVPPDASNAEIYEAYRERSKEVYPDADGGSEKAFKELKQARDEMLTDE